MLCCWLPLSLPQSWGLVLPTKPGHMTGRQITEKPLISRSGRMHCSHWCPGVPIFQLAQNQMLNKKNPGGLNATASCLQQQKLQVSPWWSTKFPACHQKGLPGHGTSLTAKQSMTLPSTEQAALVLAPRLYSSNYSSTTFLSSGTEAS